MALEIGEPAFNFCNVNRGLSFKDARPLSALCPLFADFEDALTDVKIFLLLGYREATDEA